jgi:hypothetical protein
MKFMHISNTREGIALLDQAAEQKQIFPLFGKEGVGKTALLNYWMREYVVEGLKVTTELPPCLYVDLWKTQRTTVERSVQVTPITCQLFSEIVYQMSTIPWIYAREIEASRWFSPTGTLATDSQFLALFNFVRKYFARLSCRAIIIDGGQLLDTTAIELLLRLRKVQRAPCCYVFSMQLEKAETMLAAMDSLRRKFPHAHRGLLSLVHPFELKRLEPLQFATVVLKEGFFEPLGVTPTAAPLEEQLGLDRRIAKRYWESTLGDWHSIVTMYERTRFVLKDTKSTTLTPEILERIFGSW